MKERRTHPRLSIDLEAAYVFRREPEAENKISVLNISAGGFCLLTDEEIVPKTEITLKIAVAPDKELSINVASAWCDKDEEEDKYKTGVSIRDAEGNDFEEFRNFCTEYGKNNPHLVQPRGDSRI